MANILALAGPNSRFAVRDVPPAGFAAGFWHGMTAVVTLVASLFYAGVRLYEVRNRGRVHDVGFALGELAVFVPIALWAMGLYVGNQLESIFGG